MASCHTLVEHRERDRAAQPELKASRKAAAAHPIEKVGAELRAMMRWIGANKLVDKTKSQPHRNQDARR